MGALIHELRWEDDGDSKPLEVADSQGEEVLVGDGDGEIIASVPVVNRLNSESLGDSSVGGSGEEFELDEQYSLIGGDPEEDWDLITADPASIYKNLYRAYGPKFLEWEPETLETVLKDDFDMDDIPDNIWSSILATRVAASGETRTNYVAFEKAAISIDHAPVHPGTLQDVSPHQMKALWDLIKELDLDEDGNPDNDLSDEVMRYIAARLHSDDYLYVRGIFPPQVQDFIIELGAPMGLLDMVREKIGSLKSEETLIDFLENMGNSAVDVQVARYFSLI